MRLRERENKSYWKRQWQRRWWLQLERASGDEFTEVETEKESDERRSASMATERVSGDGKTRERMSKGEKNSKSTYIELNVRPRRFMGLGDPCS